MASPTLPSNSSSPTATLTVLFFASIREAVGGIPQTELTVLADNFDTSKLRTVLIEQYPQLNSVFDDTAVTLAVNEEYVPLGQVLPLRHGDTVVLIPPISGG